MDTLISNETLNKHTIIYKNPEELHPFPENDVFPDMTATEYADFKLDVQENGIKTPLHITNDGMILAGHQRWKVASELAIVCPCFDVEGDKLMSADDRKIYVLTDNLFRRQLNTAQRAEIGCQLIDIARRKTEEKALEAGDQAVNVPQTDLATPPQDGASATPQKSKTAKGKPKEKEEKEKTGKLREKVAKQVGVSNKSIDWARKIKGEAAQNPEVAKDWQAAKAGEKTLKEVYATVNGTAKDPNVEDKSPKAAKAKLASAKSKICDVMSKYQVDADLFDYLRGIKKTIDELLVRHNQSTEE